MIPILFKDIVEAIFKWWKQIWFEAKLKANLDMIEFENRIQAELELKEKNKPIHREYPIDTKLQPSESQKLGGAIRLTAPWYTDDLQPPSSNGMP